MNIETGEIKEFSDKKELLKDLPSKSWTPVEEANMTEKQKEDMQVSKYDNKSDLGKLFTFNRKLTRKQKNRKKRQNYDNNK